jgi:ligand-binding sensor domain-containing protein
MKTRIFQRIFRNSAISFLTSLALFAFVFNHNAIAQDFWQPANGPYGGFINALAVNPSNGYIFAATDGRGVFRSTDSGVSWTAVNTNLTELRVYSIAIRSTQIFVGTSNSKVFTSIDNGDSWRLVNTGLNTFPRSDITALALESSTKIYAGTRGDGVFRSIDAGENWTPVSSNGLNNRFINAINADFPGTFLAGTDAGVFRLNSNDSWATFKVGLGNSTKVRSVAISYYDGQFSYFAATSDGVFHAIGDQNWTPINTDLTNTDVLSFLVPVFGQAQIWAGTNGNGAFRSNDNGAHWTRVTTGLTNSYARSLVASANQVFLGTPGAGVFRFTDNDNKWIPMNTGLMNTSVKAFAVNSNGKTFAGTFGGGVYRSDDHGGSWEPVNTNLTAISIAALAVNSKGYVFAATDDMNLLNPKQKGGGVFLSRNSGMTWTAVNNNLTNTDVRALAINSLGTIFVGTNGGGIFRSDNDGDSWTEFNNRLSNKSVRALAINSNGDIFAGTNGGLNSGVFRLRNNTTLWEQINSGLGNHQINSLAINRNNDLFAGTTSVVYRLSNNSNSWTEESIAFTGTNVQALAINAVGHIFAGTANQGVFLSRDNGENWESVIGDLENNTNIRSLIVDADGYIFAGTDKAGAFRSRWTTAAKPGAATDAVTNLSSNSARLNGRVNPNNLSTTAKFQYGPTASYESVAAATQNPGSGTSEVAVSANISGLSPGIVYHFRVVATNTLGTTNGADQTFTTSGTAPTVSTSAATNIGPYSATLSGMVNPNGRSTEVKFQYGTTMSYAREETVQDSVRGTTPVSASVIVTNLLPNTTYHYRLVAANDAGTTNGNNQTFATLLPAYPANLSLNTTINFPAFSRAGDFRPVDYQLVGLPGNSDSSVAKYLRGNHKKDWQVYWDNGAASDFLVEYNGGSEFNFKVGRAFWIVHKGQLIINRSIPSAPLAPSAPLSIAQIKVPLRSGWNLIANPYSRPVAWARIRGANNVPTPKVTDPIWAFNQTYSQADSLKPYAGYCFYNRQNLDTLRIPYSLYYPPASAPSTVAEPTLWRVHIALSSGEFIEKATSFGVSREASAKLDALDFRKPRAIAAIPSVSFNRSAWDKSYGIFATDIRPEFEEQESWEFEVQSTQREPLQLTFSGINRIPARFAVYLIDAARAHFVNLRNDSLYNFTPATDISKFTVHVGKAEALQEQLDALIPKEFAWEQNFPNPFNPTTAIPVIVPVTTEVRLKVYDLLGKEVKTLYSGSLEPGRHFFNWDGRDEAGKALGTGVYFYRLTTDRHTTLVGKMILIR